MFNVSLPKNVSVGTTAPLLLRLCPQWTLVVRGQHLREHVRIGIASRRCIVLAGAHDLGALLSVLFRLSFGLCADLNGVGRGLRRRGELSADAGVHPDGGEKGCSDFVLHRSERGWLI